MRVVHYPHIVHRRLIQLFVVLSLVTAIGGHWFVLQSVAWVSMTMNFAQSDSIGVALRKTFDGQHPCKLCKVVREGKQAEQKQPLLKVETKLDLLLVSSPDLVPAPEHVNWLLPDFSASASMRAHSPPVPPPRAA